MLWARNRWLGLVLTAVLVLPGCWVVNIHPFSAEQEVSDTFTTKGTPVIVVETFNGAIDVTPGEKGTVEARVTKRAGGSTQEEAEQDLENIEVTMKQEGDTIRITAEKTDHSMWSDRALLWTSRFRTARSWTCAQATAKSTSSPSQGT